ncbi:MAG: 23S rRNA (pseudouridine(1915)-N(3))-methyltransferase RlmH [Clostridiales bacterium]|nr:23S rRNA (pseudouridine(1915)-N(3))-methyltransferase RlmH [Clostridiales bacterium]
MNALILCVGHLKEKWVKEGTDDYLKRLSRLVRTQVQEVDDLPEPENSSREIEEQIIRREGEALLRQLKPGDEVIALCVEGDMVDSPGIAQILAGCAMNGRRPVFVIGGSLGLSDEVKRRAAKRISLGRITLPHRLARLVLAEQLYRAAKINAGERYHK